MHYLKDPVGFKCLFSVWFVCTQKYITISCYQKKENKMNDKFKFTL